MQYLIDWLGFSTVLYNREIDIFDYLGIKNKVQFELKDGLYGYEKSYYYDHLRINFNTNNLKYYIDLSGQGCRTFEDISSLTWHDLFKLVIINENSSVRRLDIACDDKDGILNLDTIYKLTERNAKSLYDKKGNIDEILTNFKKCRALRSDSGITVYYGSRKSEMMITMYNKAAERNIKDGSHWVRVELMLRTKKAHQAVEMVANGQFIGDIFSGAINNNLRFIDKIDSNKSRCATSRWWQEFINTTESIHFAQKLGRDYNLKDYSDFVVRQYSTVLKTLENIAGQEYVLSLIHDKEHHYSDKQRELMRRYNAKPKKGLKTKLKESEATDYVPNAQKQLEINE